MTLIRTAEIEGQSTEGTENADRALEKAKEALATIYRFTPRFAFTDVEIEYLKQRCEMIEEAILRIRPVPRE